MSRDVDAILGEIRHLSGLIAELPEGPERAALETQRELRRAAARLAADVSRPVENLTAELENVERRLGELDEVAIKPALNESYKLVTDPSAYRQKINQTIAANEAQERDALLERRDELQLALTELQSD